VTVQSEVKTEMLGLADRCETAKGPSPQIDAEIVALRNNALVKPYPPQTDFGPGQKWQFWSLDGLHFLANESHAQFKVLPVTASLDAAMTLVPEEAWWSAMRSPCADTFDAEVAEQQSRAATPALALCAAALRARAAQPLPPLSKDSV
jgi:hypothetical protein